MTSREINRRDALRLAGLSAGALLAGGAVELTSVRAAEKNNEFASFGAFVSDERKAWKFAVADPNRAAELAYSNYEVGRCMFATFKAIVFSVGEALAKIDPPAADEVFRFPFNMMRYGESGANGWGSLCGSLNGAMAAITLFTADGKTFAALCDEIGNYYERTLLPIYRPVEDGFGPMPQTIAGSVLCHISSGKWSALAQVKTGSPQRTERCKRLSADVAKKTIEILNLNAAALATAGVAPVVSLKRPEPTATCVECHDKKGTTADTIGKMGCNECHEEPVDHHLQK